MTPGALPLEKRCNQGWHVRPIAEFLGPGGRVYQDCASCRARYRGWSKKTLAEKLAARGPRADAPNAGRVLWVARSTSRKLGPMPTSISERGTCPPSCGFYDAGCYADYGKLGGHWKRVVDRGLPWGDFLERVRALPAGTLWRHNEAGDLQGDGRAIDRERLSQLVEANRGRRGFTYTHYSHLPRGDADAASLGNAAAIALANRNGFTVNLSTDTLDDAVAAVRFRGFAPIPVTVTLPHDAPDRVRTGLGVSVVVCPAQTSGTTCAECQLCANANRRAIVGFRAHGQFAKHVPELVQLRRKPAPPARESAA